MDIHYFCQNQCAERDQIESEAEAIALQQSRWNAAKNLQIPGDITFTARWLGHDPASIDRGGEKTCFVSACGPKRRVMIDGDGQITLKQAEAYIAIHWDGYGGFTTVTVQGKRVYSSHECDRFIIPGEWLQLVLNLLPQAMSAAGMSEVSSKAFALRKALEHL